MSLAAELRAALASRPPWPDALTRGLADRGWSQLAGTGIGPSSYGTLVALDRNAAAPRTIASTLPAIRAGDAPLIVETFPAGLPRRYCLLGLRPGDVSAERLSSAYGEACKALALLPEAADAVSALVRSLHVLRVDGPEYDISFSDPEVPFSVFVGVHPEAVPHDGLRLAESMLHEAMHLQLTLAEGIEPMLAGCEEERHSPWQGRTRPVQGLLHGLFVFRAIQRLLAAAAASPGVMSSDREHARRRVRDIDLEVSELAGLEGSADLTNGGRLLAATLLGSG